MRWARWRLAVVFVIAIFFYGNIAVAQRASAGSGRGECSMWGDKMRCGGSKSEYTCRSVGSGDVAPTPGSEKILACRAAAKNATQPSRLLFLSQDGKMLGVVSDRGDQSHRSHISSVKVHNIVNDARREVVIEYRYDTKAANTVGSAHRASARRKEISILRWAGSAAAGALQEVLRVCTMERPQPVSFARAAKLMYKKGNSIRVRAKQQEYYGETVKQWWSDVTYVWNPATEEFLASSCTDLANSLRQTLGPDEPEGDINAGMKCIASPPRKTARSTPPAPPKVATPTPAPPKVATPSVPTKVSTVPVVVSKVWGKAPPAREPAATPPATTTHTKVTRPWGKAPPVREKTATPPVAATKGYTTSQCLTRLGREVTRGRLLEECYESIVGLADNEAFRECNISELSRRLCRE